MTNEIDLQHYGVDYRTYPIEVAECRLYRGTDSNGPVAVKIFPDLPISKLKDYANLTNYVAGQVNNRGVYRTFVINDQVERLLIQIVEILRVGITCQGFIGACTISTFIEGPTLLDIDTYYQSKHVGQKNEPLRSMSVELNKDTKRNGIGIIPWNVKIIDSTAFITDLCGSIASLK